MRIVVTGGSGFIGTNLIEHFLAGECEVLNLDIAPPRNREHARYWRHLDLRDAAGVNDVMQGFDPNFILHMGARTDLDGRGLSDYSANTVGVENLIAATDGMKSLQRIVFASSRLVCRIGYQPSNDRDYCPTTPYGESKVVGEQIVRAAAGRIPCPWVIVRPTSIWGPWFDVPYKTFFLVIAKGRYFHPGHAQVPKSFGYVGNTIYELQRLLEVPAESISGKTFYLADYPPIEVAKMADSIQHELGVAPIRRVGVAGLRAVARTCDVLKWFGWRHPPLTTFRLNNLLTPMVHDLEPLRKIAGELPYSMEDGVHLTASWLKSQGEVR